jgi:hypothetical protein
MEILDDGPYRPIGGIDIMYGPLIDILFMVVLIILSFYQ